MLNVNLTTLYDWAAAGVEKGAHPAAQLEAVSTFAQMRFDNSMTVSVNFLDKTEIAKKSRRLR